MGLLIDNLGGTPDKEASPDVLSDAMKQNIKNVVEREMEQLRHDVQAANAAANAAYGEILQLNQQTRMQNMLEKLNKSHQDYVHETVDLAVLKGREQTEERLTQLDKFYQARFQTQDKIIRVL